eukprot:1161085-Pelagomonas_calceolata.AAC.3
MGEIFADHPHPHCFFDDEEFCPFTGLTAFTLVLPHTKAHGPVCTGTCPTRLHQEWCAQNWQRWPGWQKAGYHTGIGGLTLGQGFLQPQATAEVAGNVQANWWVPLFVVPGCRDVHDSTTSSMVAGRGLYGIDGDQLIKIKPTVVVTQCACVCLCVNVCVCTHAHACVCAHAYM